MDTRWVLAGMLVTTIAWVLGIGAALVITAGGVIGGVVGRLVQHVVRSPPDLGALYKALLGASRGQ